MREKTSKISMCMTNSTGSWLNGALQPQNHYVSMEIQDPDHKIVARVALTFEQVTKMLMYSGEVDCTLTYYRDTEGKLAKEEVQPKATIDERMKSNIKEMQDKFNDNINALYKMVGDIINKNSTASKSNLNDILRQIQVLKDHYASNESFMLSEAENELRKSYDNAVCQLGIFIQSKTGIEAPENIVKSMLPVNDIKMIENKEGDL